MEEAIKRPLRPIPTKLFVPLFAAIGLMLGAGYYLFLRTDYAVLYSDLRTADASAVVAELDRRGVAYQLRDGGSTIAVPEGAAASARLAIAGSDVPSRGAVGFELFNESDMGLTDFAQRINYQRALQGELARTIMMMSGVESARVHLALPERSLFRGNRSAPTAAVTLTPARGGTIDAGRVAGIQRLVAAAVPDLAVGDVVVLDDVGRLISLAEAPDTSLPPDLEEHEAVQRYFRGRARTAIQNVLPNARFDVRVLIGDAALVAAEDPTAAAAPVAAAPGATAGRRNFAVRVIVTTEEPLAPAETELVRNAVTGAVELDEQFGDVLQFTVGPLPVMAAPSPAAPAAIMQPPSSLDRREPPVRSGGWPSPWWLALAGAAALLSLFLIRRARQPALSPEERDAFVERVRSQLRLVEEGDNARA